MVQEGGEVLEKTKRGGKKTSSPQRAFFEIPKKREKNPRKPKND